MQHQPTKLLKAVPASVSTSLQLLCATVAVALLVPAPSVSTSLQLSKAAPASVSNSLQLSKAALRKLCKLGLFWVYFGFRNCYEARPSQPRKRFKLLKTFKTSKNESGQPLSAPASAFEAVPAFVSTTSPANWVYFGFIYGLKIRFENATKHFLARLQKPLNPLKLFKR